MFRFFIQSVSRCFSYSRSEYSYFRFSCIDNKKTNIFLCVCVEFEYMYLYFCWYCCCWANKKNLKTKYNECKMETPCPHVQRSINNLCHFFSALISLFGTFTRSLSVSLTHSFALSPFLLLFVIVVVLCVFFVMNVY